MGSQNAETVTQDATHKKYLHAASSMVAVVGIDSSFASDAQSIGDEQISESMRLVKVQPTPTQALSKPKSDVSTAVLILRIIESYGNQYKSINHQWGGIDSYVPLVVAQIRARKPVRILFTGFGFKSPLALGRLPDLGEKLALAHLNALCSNIATVYEIGAEVHVSSDGLLYNGLRKSRTLFCVLTDSSQICSVFQTKLFGPMWKVFVRS